VSHARRVFELSAGEQELERQVLFNDSRQQQQQQANEMK
jgi:hypothetical protein